jgi:hemolysin activation/secretion protein
VVTTRPLRVLALALTAATLFPCFAQDRQTKTSVSRPDGAALVTPTLKGLVFISDPSALRPNGIDTVGVVTTGIDMLSRPSFRNLLTPFLGKPVTFDGLTQITHTVIVYYTSHKYPLVNVVVPEQDVQNGVIQVVVTEFRVGSIRTKGNRWFPSSMVAAPLTLHHGDTINSARLLSELDAANANPFRHVNLVYEPAPQPGYTDLVLQTEDRFPLRFFSGFDNSGTAATGHNRWNAGVTWGDAFGLDQQMTYQFSSSSDLYLGSSRGPGSSGGPAFASHSLAWSMPLSFGDSVSVFGDYERTVPNIGPDLDLIGLNGQASIRYNHALPRTADFVQSLQAGYDFKTTNNNLNFSGVAILASSVEIDQFPVSYSANLTDRWGVSSSSTTLVYSPGALTPNNTASAFQSAGSTLGIGLASNRYLYLKEDFSRLTKLPYGVVWSTRVVAQASNASLLYTEQLVGGGPDLLRGYPTNSILGDDGIIMSNELRAPSLRRAFGQSIGRLQFLGFWDYGSLRPNKAIEGYDGNVDASSIGAGLRYGLRRNITAKFDYGWQLRSLPGIPGGGHLANIALVVGN